MEDWAREGLAGIAADLAEEICARLADAAADLGESEGELSVEVYWKLWDAVIELEREKRAEWMLGEPEAEREADEERRAHPDDYDQLMRARTLEAQDLLRQWLARRFPGSDE